MSIINLLHYIHTKADIGMSLIRLSDIIITVAKPLLTNQQNFLVSRTLIFVYISSRKMLDKCIRLCYFWH